MLIQFVGDDKQSRFNGDGIIVKKLDVVEVTEKQKELLYEDHAAWWKDKNIRPNFKTPDVTDKNGKVIKTGKSVVVTTKELQKPVINSHGLYQSHPEIS
ncbi:hypothetical protein LCGC14_2085630 [marine sediment metagenome]|uniref:Uncharacterized protein n=2 Tax=root TaxID=1 RepID=A0A831VPJ3_9FLAO|nr:hypothetical protein [Pricia antarctica]